MKEVRRLIYPFQRRASVFLSARTLNRLYRYDRPRDSWNMTIERLLDEAEESQAVLAKGEKGGGDEKSAETLHC